MKKFYRKIDKRDRAEMTGYLENHFRYFTARSWNGSTSYANDVKLYNLGLPGEMEEKLLDMTGLQEFYDRLGDTIDLFARSHGYKWQAGFNGRSGGYLVLYQGGQKPSGYRSYCTSCGQRNYTSVKETGCTCGRCGKNTRKDYRQPPMLTYTLPGAGVDMDKDFGFWDLDELRSRVTLVQEFDRLCDNLLAEAISMAEEYEVVEETVYVPETVRSLRRAGA